MNVHVVPDGSVAIVQPSGELDLAASPSLRAVLLEACARHDLTIADLSKVTFVDSAAVGVLVYAAKRCRHDGHQMRVLNARARIVRAMGALGADTMLGVNVGLADLDGPTRALLGAQPGRPSGPDAG